LDLKHPGHRAETYPLGQRSYHPHQQLGRHSFALKHRAPGFQKVRLTYHTLQLAPRPAPRMPIRVDIAAAQPSIIGPYLLGTVMLMSSDRARASLFGDEHGWRRRPQGRVAVSLVMLTPLAERLLGQASKGLGGLWESLGLLSRRVFRCLPSLPRPI